MQSFQQMQIRPRLIRFILAVLLAVPLLYGCIWSFWLIWREWHDTGFFMIDLVDLALFGNSSKSFEDTIILTVWSITAHIISAFFLFAGFIMPLIALCEWVFPNCLTKSNEQRYYIYWGWLFYCPFTISWVILMIAYESSYLTSLRPFALLGLGIYAPITVVLSVFVMVFSAVIGVLLVLGSPIILLKLLSWCGSFINRLLQNSYRPRI